MKPQSKCWYYYLIGQEHGHTTSAPTLPPFNLYSLLSSEKVTNLLLMLILPIFELHLNRIIIFFNCFTNGFSFTQIVRFTHVIAYRNSSLPHVVLYLRISHSLIYLPSLPLRAIWVISSWEIILHWAFFLMLPIACHPPAP